MARLEHEPEQVVEGADVHEQPVHQVADPRHVIWPAVSVPNELGDVRADFSRLPRRMQRDDEVGEAKVRPTTGHILWHDGEALQPARPTYDVGVDREVVLGTHVCFRVTTRGANRKLLPEGAAFVVALVTRVSELVVSRILHSEGNFAVITPFGLVLHHVIKRFFEQGRVNPRGA